MLVSTSRKVFNENNFISLCYHVFMSTKKLVLILIGATFLAYFSSFSNPFIWDDEQFITSNAYVRNFDIGKIFTTNTVAGAGVQSNYYRPLTTLSFAVDTAIWGSNPFGFHLTNLLSIRWRKPLPRKYHQPKLPG